MEFSQDHAGHNPPPFVHRVQVTFLLCAASVAGLLYAAPPLRHSRHRRFRLSAGGRLSQGVHEPIREAFDPRQGLFSAPGAICGGNAGSRRAGGRAAICKRSAGRSRRDRPGGRLQRGGRCASCGSGGGHCAACGSAPAFGVGCTGAFGCVGTCDRLWFRGDFLMWWTPRRTCRRGHHQPAPPRKPRPACWGSRHKRPLRKRG